MKYLSFVLDRGECYNWHTIQIYQHGREKYISRAIKRTDPESSNIDRAKSNMLFYVCYGVILLHNLNPLLLQKGWMFMCFNFWLLQYITNTVIWFEDKFVLYDPCYSTVYRNKPPFKEGKYDAESGECSSREACIQMQTKFLGNGNVQ